jgi:ribosomal protein L40E
MPESTESDTPVVPEPSKAPDDSVTKLFCRHCGTSVSPQASVCLSCGAAQQPLPPTPPPVPQAAPAGKFCGNCGSEVGSHAVVCLKCGASVQPAGASHSAVVQSAQAPLNPKSPALAVFLSFVWPGGGQLYAGDSSPKTIILLMAGVFLLICYLTLIGLVLLPVGLGLAVYAMIDARNVARNWNVAHGFPASGQD